jgi:prolipoprotein diacylglyceryltransferase
MRQVFFHIPLHSLWDALPDIPIYGYGTMLFLAFVFCTWLAVRLGRREGISRERIQDLAIWIFVGGVIGARAVFIIQYHSMFTSFWQFFQLWDGGLVFYGGPIGAVIAYYVAYFLWLRKDAFSSWKMADVVAPCAALGLALGRVGCLLNGCCYGNVACTECPAVHFPLCAPPVTTMVKRGYQTAAGFTVQTSPPDSNHPTNVVRSVLANSPAEQAGLKPGDKIVKVNGKDTFSYNDLDDYLRSQWPRGETELELMVARDGPGGETTQTIGPFRPMTIGLHPTQIYESISMVLLLFFLLSYYPFKRRDGSVMVLFMVGYAVHRFLNEMLRTDTEKVAFNMTLSQNISIVVLIAAAILALAVWMHGPRMKARLA